MVDALAINDYREPQYHGRKSKPWGNGIPANLCRAKVAREPKPTAKAAKPAAAVAPPIVQPSIAISRAPVVGRRLKSYGDVVQAFRDRADELEVSRNEIDYLSRLATGYASVLLMKTTTPRKIFGPVSLGRILDALGLRLVVVEDDDLTARTLKRRTKRMSTHAHYGPEFPPISGPAKGWLFGYPAPIAGKRNQ